MKIYLVAFSIICCPLAIAGVKSVSETKGILPVCAVSQEEADGWIRYLDARYHNSPVAIPKSALQLKNIYLQDILFGFMYVHPKLGEYVYVFTIVVNSASDTRRYRFEFASPRAAGEEVANLDEFWRSIAISRYAVVCYSPAKPNPTADFVILNGVRQ